MVTVSLSGSSNAESDRNLLVEQAGTVATLSLTLDAPPTSESLGPTVTLSSPNLTEFDLTQIQVEGGNLALSESLQSQLETALNEKVTDTVPGGAIALTTPLGDWSGAAGVANVANNVPIEARDRFEVGSVTKPFTAATLLKLVEAGTLTLEDTLTDWLPETVTATLPNADAITLRHLLNHTSGVAEYDAILVERGMANPTIFLRDWLPEDIVGLIADSPPFFAPGEGWQYANTNFILAGMVIEAATGNDLASEIRTHIIDPLGLQNTFLAAEEEIPDGYVSGYLDFDEDGNLDDVSIANLSWTWAAGAIVSNTEDLIQFSEALYGGELLSTAAQSEMFTLVDTGRGYSYGLGMMSFETPDLGQVVGHRGGSLGFNANMWHAAEQDFTYVELLNGRTNETLANDTIPRFREGLLPTVGNTIGNLTDSGQSQINITLDAISSDPAAQILLPIADDGLTEGEETATFSVQPGANYSVNLEAQTSQFTIIDSIVDSPETPPMTFPDRVTTALDNALDSNLPVNEVPGAAVAILTPEGEWFGASGVSDIANSTPLQPDDRFEAGSITKTFVATTLLQLTEEGAISLEDRLTDWLPAAVSDRIPNASEITIEQLLNHTSGIADYLDILSAQALSNPTLFLQQWEPAQLLGFLEGVEPFFEPGTDWQYSNSNYVLAGLVIEAVTGNSYGQEIRDRILDPLSLDNTFVSGEEEIPGGYIKSYWDFDNNGELDDLSITNLSWTGAAGSIISNTEDLSDFFDALLVEGALLEAQSLEEMLDTIPVDSPNYDSYGLGIGTIESRDRFWYVHRGQTLGFRSNLWYSPLEEITYVELLNGRSDTNLVSDLLPTYRRTITPPTPDPITYEFDWEGQIAGFSVEGEFTYDASALPTDGIIREENLEAFNISFFDPAGNLLQTYEDNHLTFDAFNFAFDTSTQQVLTDGLFDGPEGINVGEKTAVEDGFTGLNLWSKSKETSSSLVHLDDWSDEFGFPLGYSSHEDIAFLTQTTAELIETGKVGETYLDQIQDSPNQDSLTEVGSPIVVSPPENETGEYEIASGATSLFLDFSLFESAGLLIQNAAPTADPFSNQFQLGFEISPSTNFGFESNPFSPLAGTIEHTGTISFLANSDIELTIGDFSVGFDANRISETTSGFFVADTLEDPLGVDILFDLSVPDRLQVQAETLTIADTDLLLAPELAGVLGLNDAIGTDVGDVRIDAALVEVITDPPPLTELLGTASRDRLIGSEADEFIDAFAGNDVAKGGAGNDQIIGNSGRDRLFGDEGDDVVEGNSGQDRLFGGAGRDILLGGSGSDRLFGNQERDILLGSTGDDFLNGGDGDDVLISATGHNVLLGGSGADLFVFRAGSGTDSVRDFETGTDRIGLVDGELTFADITITQAGGRTLLGIASSGETLAILRGIEASSLSESSFETVPNVATVEDALMIL